VIDRENNFDTIRLLAATSVIFSHSFLLVDQNELREPFVRLLGAHNIVGIYGVFVFFIISGYLVTQSYFRSASPLEFLYKRALRIFPALIVCAFILAFIVAPIFSNKPLQQYYLNTDGYRYFFRTIFLFKAPWPDIEGVSIYNLPYGVLLNGSLWSIQSEVLCYLGLLLLGILKLLDLRTSVALLVLGIISNHFFDGGKFVLVLPAFAAGMCLFFICKTYPLSGVLAIIALVGLIIGGASGNLRDVAFPIFGSYAIIYLGFSKTISLGRAARFGDVSYGTYLYGWPVEQCVRAAFGDGAKWWIVFSLSVPIALLLGFVSWHAIEKVALRYRSLPVWAQSAFRGAGLLGPLASPVKNVYRSDLSAQGRRLE
jgi:peptidoglycan/LPS O-acetylase OafA/YrhL